MSSNKADNVVKYLAIAGTLGLSYLLINFLSKPKGAPTLSLERTRKALQEIKYQMYSNCISFAEGVNTKLKAKYPENELTQYLRGEVAKLYESKEALIIDKYGVSKEEYSASLQKYSEDQLIKKNVNEILEMMEGAIKGIFPDMTVHPDASKLLSNDQIRQVFKDMCQLIAVKVWEKLDQNKKNNPNFDSKDDSHFKMAIRQLSVYDLKIQFLAKKGFRKEWGCPNQVFFKIMENIKQVNPTFKAQSAIIEKAYEKIIEKVTNSPQGLTPQVIKNEMNNYIANEVQNPIQAVNASSLSRSQPIPVPKPQPQQQQNLFSSARTKPPQKPKEDDEFDMEKLMMEELLKRSQQHQKVAIQTVSQPKVEVPEVKPQIVAQIPAEDKVEQVQNVAEQKIDNIELQKSMQEVEAENILQKNEENEAKVQSEIVAKAQPQIEIKVQEVASVQEVANVQKIANVQEVANEQVQKIVEEKEIVQEQPFQVKQPVLIEVSADIVEETSVENVEKHIKNEISEQIPQKVEILQPEKTQSEPVAQEIHENEENKIE